MEAEENGANNELLYLSAWSITAQIADAVMEYLKPKGVLVWCEAEHTCMTCRGVRKPGTKTTTYCTRGEFTSEKVMQVLAVVK